jgi:hypothetical protein
MAEKKEKKSKAAVVPEDTPPVSAPKIIAPTPPKHPKIPKLAKKNKSRMPRKQKKAQQKAARAHQS